MSIMGQSIEAVKTILVANTTINYDFTGYFDDFVAEEYPAICAEPDTGQSLLGNGLNFNYDDGGRVKVYYVEEAPENRDMTAFITKVDSLVEIIKQNPRLDGTLNQGVNITVKYMRRGPSDNIEFISMILIEGRNYYDNL